MVADRGLWCDEVKLSFLSTFTKIALHEILFGDLDGDLVFVILTFPQLYISNVHFRFVHSMGVIS